MRTVWKYEIPVGDRPSTVAIPYAATILPVADCPGRGEDVAIWAEVDTTAARELRTFLICGTGHPLPFGGIYRATAIWRLAPKDNSGALKIDSPRVWHVFEVTL